MGWQPKSPLTASGRGNQPAERLPEFKRGCPGPSNIITPISIWAKVLSKLSMANKSLWLNATWDNLIEYVWHTLHVVLPEARKREDGE